MKQLVTSGYTLVKAATCISIIIVYIVAATCAMLTIMSYSQSGFVSRESLPPYIVDIGHASIAGILISAIIMWLYSQRHSSKNK